MCCVYMENHVKSGLDCGKGMTLLFSVNNYNVYIKDNYAYVFQRLFISIEHIFVIYLHDNCVQVLCIIWMTTLPLDMFFFLKRHDIAM